MKKLLCLLCVLCLLTALVSGCSKSKSKPATTEPAPSDPYADSPDGCTRCSSA